ncbi:hypothetical protein [Acetivibrio straminisolvens]|jgi:hypothetical protein|uniref:hypothetical protein n=1 Tax=Acetivibrio straminisolvens TaxID=253314 RepID=UPI00223EAA64|nr:hypothetical protein [Acetivibrio straminisolvens]
MFCPKCKCEYRDGALTGNVDLVVNLPLEESKNKQHVLKNKLQLKTKTKYYFFNSISGFFRGIFPCYCYCYWCISRATSAGNEVTNVCSILALYELYFTRPAFGDDLAVAVLLAQFALQVVLVLLLILLLGKQVNRLVVVQPLLMMLFSGVIIIATINLLPNESLFSAFLCLITLATIFINYFNPVLLYILSYTAKRKLGYKI